MKTIATALIALSLAVTAMPTTASAGGIKKDVLAAGAIGFVGGALAAGLLAPRQAPQRVYVNAAGAHEGWCSAKYRSYNPYDNTWVDKHGRLHYCVSPY